MTGFEKLMARLVRRVGINCTKHILLLAPKKRQFQLLLHHLTKGHVAGYSINCDKVRVAVF